MSKIVSQTATQNMLTTIYDTTKLVLKGGEYNNAVYTNSTGVSVTILVGTLLGRVSATNQILPLKSTAVDGSQFPIGISTQEIIVPLATSATLEFVIAGEVEGTLLVLDGTDTLATPISGKTLGDRIKADT